MPSVNCFRRVLLDVGGKKIIISVPHGMTETEVNKVMIVTRGYLQQYVYVEMVLAECFMQKIEKSILKKKCVRFEVKKKWVDCKKNLRKAIKYYDAYVPNADFNNEFAMTFYDKISEDLYKLRDKLAVRLQNLGIGEKSGVYANAIILYNLTNLCLGTYENIIRKLFEELHVNLMQAFKDFAPILAFENSYDFMALVMDKDFERLADHLMTKEILSYFDKVRKGLFNEQTLNEASINATEDLTDEEKSSQRAYIGISDFMKSDYPWKEQQPRKLANEDRVKRFFAYR